MAYKKIFFLFALILLVISPNIASAQDNGDLPTYIVQPGENLTEISSKFRISLDDLIRINNILDVNVISAGTELVIPGLEGVSGVLTAEPTAFGDSYQALLRKYRLSQQTFLLLNPLTSPAEIFAGSTLVLPISDNQDNTHYSLILDNTDSLMSASVKSGKNTWAFAIDNKIKPYSELPGDKLFFYSDKEINEAILNPAYKIEVNPLPIMQGHTVSIRIYTKEQLILSGYLGAKDLTFFQDQSNEFQYALTGISAIAEPGIIPLSISGIFSDESSFLIEENLLLVSGGYREEELTVEQTTIEPDVIESENLQIQQILNPVTPEKLWSEKFRFPVDGSLTDDSIGISSYFGSRRSYNNGLLSGYHGGLDFKVVLMSLNIYAPAPGKIIFSGPLTIRGNATFIDHGQGIISGYAHQSESKVAVGDIVQTGQIIGTIGKTGRVTGPHLHWEIWVNGTQVDPFDWIENTYP